MFPTNINQKPTQDCIRWAQNCIGSKINCEPLPEHAHQDKHMYTLTEQYSQAQFLLVESYHDVPSMLKFITLAKILRHNSVHTPEIFHQEITTHRCWVIMSHFGHETLLDWLVKSNNPIQKKEIFEHCLREIKNFQVQKIPYAIGSYSSDDMMKDMSLSESYFCEKLLNQTLSDSEKSYLAHAKTTIAETCSKMPQGIMHFDFHSANIMLLPKRTLGILDFQDLKFGPIIYDLVSLLTDHYYLHQPHEINYYIKYYHRNHLTNFQKQNHKLSDFIKQFNIVTVQRHLKNIGIFSRLFTREKRHYLKHIPRMMHQLKQSCNEIEELKSLPDILWSTKIKQCFANTIDNHCRSSFSTQQIDSLAAEVNQN